MIPMELVGVRVELPSNTPIVLLRAQEDAGETDGLMLPIFIGGPEATSIALAQQGVEPPRPMTHDLFAQTLEAMDVTIEKVVITELRERTFFADLHVRSPTEARVISSRPSDAIALAVRLGIPIFAEDGSSPRSGTPRPPRSSPRLRKLSRTFETSSTTSTRKTLPRAVVVQ